MKKCFPKKAKNGQVTAWLKQEYHLVILHKKGIRVWQHPSGRNFRQTEGGQVLFEDYL